MKPAIFRLPLSLSLTPETVTVTAATGPELVKIGVGSELGDVVTRVAARALAEREVPVGVQARGERHGVVGGEETFLKQVLNLNLKSKS